MRELTATVVAGVVRVQGELKFPRTQHVVAELSCPGGAQALEPNSGCQEPSGLCCLPEAGLSEPPFHILKGVIYTYSTMLIVRGKRENEQARHTR